MSIKEIPLDIQDNDINTPDISPKNPDNSPDIPDIVSNSPELELDIPQELPEIIEKPAKAKAKGRPKGSRNLAPSKPRPKKVVFEEKPIEEYSPSSPKRNLAIPAFGVNEVAVEMLKLLGNQKNVRQQRKSALYQSWFA